MVVDAGHGGIDGGATSIYSENNEAEINLAIACVLRETLQKYGIGVVMTRTTADSLADPDGAYFKRRDMDERLKIVTATSPDALLSIHVNKFSSSTRRGAQVFYKRGEESKSLAARVQEKLNADINAVESGRDYSIAVGDYYLLNKSPCPAVIIECGFLSNPEDARLLASDTFRTRLCESIAAGVITYLASRG